MMYDFLMHISDVWDHIGRWLCAHGHHAWKEDFSDNPQCDYSRWCRRFCGTEQDYYPSLFMRGSRGEWRAAAPATALTLARRQTGT